jgi:alkyl hydroperoxide reductase subunit AhpC
MLIASFSFAITGAELAKELNLSPSSKAMIQWENVFKNKRKMKRLGINKLSDADKEILKQYLIEHAADSPEPIAAGM